MDIHEVPEGTTAEDIAKAHAKDMETQRKYGVDYRKYWFNESGRKVFCLCDAPNAEAAECVHREAHGLIAEKIIEIQPDLAEGFLGTAEPDESGAVVISGRASNEAGSWDPHHPLYRHCRIDGIDSNNGRSSGHDVV